MPALTALQLNDLTQTTIRELNEPNFIEIATDLQEYTAMKRLFKKNKRTIQSGFGVQWDVMVNHSGLADNVGLGAQDNIEIVDTMTQAQADWRNTVAHWTVIGQEISMNKGKRQIVNLMVVRRRATMIALAELAENNFWGPPVSLSDEVTPWGVNTWVVKNASEGFNGGAPSGYSSIGLNPTTHPRWKNYTALYANITKTDLIRKWRKAARKTNFKPPVDEAGPTGQTYQYQYGYYTTEPVIGILEEILEGQNDNLGLDIDPMNNKPVFQRTPIEWVPILDADTTNPIYGLNWKHIEVIALQDWWMRQTPVPVYPGQHTVSATFIDLTYQIVFRNRRSHFVLATGVTYPA